MSSGGPADDAGIETGDGSSRSAAGRVADAATLSAAIDAHKPNERVEVKVVRDGQTKTISVTLGERPASASSPATAATGHSLAPISAAADPPAPPPAGLPRGLFASLLL